MKRLMLIFLILGVFGCHQKNVTTKTQTQKVYVEKCQKCNQAWESDSVSEPILECPSCPMTLEELEEFRKQLKEESNMNNSKTMHIMEPRHCTNENCPHENKGISAFYQKQMEECEPVSIKTSLMVLAAIVAASFAFATFM